MILPTKQELLAALATTDRLAPAPRTLGRALLLLRDPNSGLDAIAELIRRDSALAVDVLRGANSAYYSRPTHVADVGDAVQVIGFAETVRLVSLVAAHQTTNRNLSSYGIPAEDFWAESLFNGLLLEALVRHIGSIDAGEAYTIGLLRFVGRLAIDQALQDFGSSLFWDGHTPLAEWESEHVGVTQAEVGALLLRKWQFPEAIVLAVEGQGLAAPATSAPVVQAAHFVARMLPDGTNLATINSLAATPVSFPADHPFALVHHLDAETLTQVRAEALRGFAGIRETLYR